MKKMTIEQKAYYDDFCNFLEDLSTDHNLDREEKEELIEILIKRLQKF